MTSALVPCGQRLQEARASVKWAYALFVGSIAAVGVALALNAGFFSAPFSPAAMITAAALAAAAAAKLGEAATLLRDYRACGGLALDRYDEADYVADSIARAGAAAWSTAGLCLGV